MNPVTRVFREVGVLACVAAACWPLTLLTQGQRDAHTMAIVVGIVALTGVLLRTVKAPSGVTLVGTFLAGLAGTAFVLTQQGYALSPSGISQLARDAGAIIDKSVTPLPDRPAIIVVIAAGAAIVAWVIDYVAGASRMPILTAIPLAAPFVVAAAALGDTVDAKYFVAAALAWTILALATFRAEVRRLAASRRLDRSSWISTAAVLTAAVIAIALALQIPKAIPHQETPALAQNAGQGVDSSVDFSENLDLTKSLNSKNDNPVLVYDSDSPHPLPLRVTGSSTYADGIWKATAKSDKTTQESVNTQLPQPGVDPKVPAATHRNSVTVNGIPAPLVAAPAPLIAANFNSGNETFKMTSNSQVPLLKSAPASYSVLYRDFTAKARPTSDQPVTSATPSVTEADLSLDGLPDAARKRVTALAQQTSKSKSTRFDKAVAMQRYFRTDPSFTYSLQLAPTRTVNGEKLDPLSNFLETKQGYCTQYATAMIMMARSQGIPARMAIGFLPGDAKKDGKYTVRAADAHAWPELYFPGMGWTRFDPTPSSRSGAAPAYAPDYDASRDSATSSSSSSSSSSTSTTTSSSSTPSSSSSTTSSTAAPQQHQDDSSIWGTIAKVLGALVLAALLLSILPLAGRRERSRLLQRATTTEGKAEGHWHEAAWRLRDLGFPTRPGLSPRATAAAFRDDYPNHTALADLVEKACARLEDARYAAPASTGRLGTSAKDALVHAAQQDASFLRRVRALLFPASGIAFFTRLLKRR